jgi:hypothetical protein
MKIKFLLLLLFPAFIIAFAQDSSRILSREVVYFKNPTKETSNPKKAYLKKITTTYENGIHKEEMVRLSDSSIYYRRIQQHGTPVGTWIESTKNKQTVEVNTAQINYCVGKERQKLIKDTVDLPELNKEIYDAVVQASHFPPIAKSLNLTSTVYIKYELSSKNRMQNICVVKWVHPVLDLVSINTIKSLVEFENPLDANISYTVPLRYRLR